MKTLKQGRVIALEGSQVIEAVEKRDSKGRVRVLAVQFHPEDMNTPESEKLFLWMRNNAEKIRALDLDATKSIVRESIKLLR